jgi:hypothetical protein
MLLLPVKYSLFELSDWPCFNHPVISAAIGLLSYFIAAGVKQPPDVNAHTSNRRFPSALSAMVVARHGIPHVAAR